MQHIEQAGVHSGDSACSLPPYTLSVEIQDELRRQTALMAKALNVVGLMNVQFAIQGDVTKGLDAATVARLGRTNWIRTLCWTARSGLVLFMTVRALSGA